ncbi:MAG: co-chaperone GroES [Clostridiales bacterium]|nr:co-chaperone GroES [Clostridiales bacterium]
MKMRPLGERVIVKVTASEEVTKGGIVLPDAAKEKPQEAEVVAVGPGRLAEDGKRIPLEITVGDRVLFAKFSGTEVKKDGVEYLILNAERDILAIVE